MITFIKGTLFMITAAIIMPLLRGRPIDIVEAFIVFSILVLIIQASLRDEKERNDGK